MDSGLGQNRLSKEIQHSLDELNRRTETSQNVSPDGQTGSPKWPRVAEALIPGLMQVFSGVLPEAVRTEARTADQIMEIVVGHGLRWALPPELIPDIQIFVLKYIDLPAQLQRKIQEFLRRFAAGEHPSICYEVFQHGRTEYYYDELPEEVLKLKKTALFWIYRSANELLSRGEPRERSEWLPPRAEEMLRFLCRTENAGKDVCFLDLYQDVWKPTVPHSDDKIYNSIGEAQNAINAFAGKRFIKTVSNKSAQDDDRVLRIWGCNEFKVGREVSAELVVIKRIVSR